MGEESTDVFPTYYKDALLHPDAENIIIQSDVSVTMQMLAKPNQSVGSVSIGGRVIGNYDEGSRKKEEGVSNLPVYLLDENLLSVIESTNTDNDGYFEFKDIPN